MALGFLWSYPSKTAASLERLSMIPLLWTCWVRSCVDPTPFTSAGVLPRIFLEDWASIDDRE